MEVFARGTQGISVTGSTEKGPDFDMRIIFETSPTLCLDDGQLHSLLESRVIQYIEKQSKRLCDVHQHLHPKTLQSTECHREVMLV